MITTFARVLIETAQVVVGVVSARIVASTAILQMMLAMFRAASRFVVVVVVDHLFNGTLAHAKAAHAIAGTAKPAVPESMQNRLDALKRECACRNARGRLHRAS